MEWLPLLERSHVSVPMSKDPKMNKTATSMTLE